MFGMGTGVASSLSPPEIDFPGETELGGLVFANRIGVFQADPGLNRLPR